MVTDTKDYMGGLFGTMAEGFRSAMETGRRTQESMFKAMNENYAMPVGFEQFQSQQGRWMDEWAPFVQKNFDATMEMVDGGMKVSQDFVRTSLNATRELDAESVKKNTRQLWDASFKAMQTNMDLLNTASSKTMQNVTDFWGAACNASHASKPASKNGK